jgi:site-specific DNA recombinase
MQMAAIYARVSSEQQREAHTIASQTAALIELARTLDLDVPKAWIFEDEGYSGATLERPGLERVRDLAAEGQIEAVLVYSPDRLSRKYAYQILLIEELARHGVETRFLNAPQSATAEDQLLVQFQGMIAEYERAQILERSRRGKRHRARAGEVSVLSGAPYGYRYIRKRDDVPASYAVIESEARVVRQVYDHYTVTGWSIGAITRWLNDEGVPTRKVGTRWERSTVWAMLRNPAYIGTACLGKTRIATRQRVTRRLRARGGLTTRNSANHERPREEWIEIPVPALIDEPTFVRAQELLHENNVRARRRTITPSLVQGLVSCHRCGYALSRVSTRSSARLIHYYRCIGSDGWRHLGGPRCGTRPVRQDLLDEIVWTEVIRLLEDPTLIQQELDRRLDLARAADPTRQRVQALQRDLVRVGKSIERLLTAYQEDLLSLEQLRERMPPLRQRERAVRTEWQSIAEQTRERATCLRLAETLSAFLARLREAADTLDIVERQRIVRLVIKDVLVGDETIVIRHCIPVTSGPTNGSGPHDSDSSNNGGDGRSYLLRSGSNARPLRRAFDGVGPHVPIEHAGPQPSSDEAEDSGVGDPMRNHPQQPLAFDRVEEATDVCVQHPVHVLRHERRVQRSQRQVRTPAGPESVREADEVDLVDGTEHFSYGTLDNLVFQCRNAERSLPTIRFGDIHAAHRFRPVLSAVDAVAQVLQLLGQTLFVRRYGFPVDSRCRSALEPTERSFERLDIHVVQQRRESGLLISACGFVDSHKR